MLVKLPTSSFSSSLFPSSNRVVTDFYSRSRHHFGPSSRPLHNNRGCSSLTVSAQSIRVPKRTSPALFAKAGYNRYAPEIEELYRGYESHLANISATNRQFLKNLALEGQKPQFMILSCCDSRINEQEIFATKPGTMFTTRNIANQFHEDDLTSNAVLSFAVEILGILHVIVMGHYGCGGVAASMIPAGEPSLAVAPFALQNWIKPIRELYVNSTRPEIVAHRKFGHSEPPHLHDPAFRALVEENIKSNVRNVAQSAVIQNHYTHFTNATATGLGPGASKPAIVIYGLVYDLESGKVSDLGVSVGPPNMPIPQSPFPLLHGTQSC